MTEQLLCANLQNQAKLTSGGEEDVMTLPQAFLLWLASKVTQRPSK